MGTTQETAMVNAPIRDAAAGEQLRARQVYLAAAICLLVGLGIGYVSRGLQSPLPVQPTARNGQPSGQAAAGMSSLDQLKQMGDTQAAPLLEKLKSNPHDSALLSEVGAIYHSSHQFKEAAAYYEKAVQADPKNVALRSKLAANMYRSGDVDGGIGQLNQALAVDPKDANALFNLGMIRLQGKNDGRGALDAWQRLLKSNPQLSPERKAEVQKLMADDLTSMGRQPASQKGVRP
jgi:cytochrome c-type biogenesis protein CcmH/NrfG